MSIATPYAVDLGYRDNAWESWGTGALILGSILTVLGILLQILEIVRIYGGLYNYGLKNFDYSDNGQFGVPVSPENEFFLGAEKWHMWPWTYPGTAIGIIVMIAGLTGIVSALRKSYTTVFSFFAFSLLSTLLPGFLVACYAVLISWYIKSTAGNAELWNTANRPDSADISYGIVSTLLALSILTIIIAFLSTVLSLIGGKIGIRRKLFVDYYGNSKNILNPAFIEPRYF